MNREDTCKKAQTIADALGRDSVLNDLENVKDQPRPEGSELDDFTAHALDEAIEGRRVWVIANVLEKYQA